MSIIKPGVVIKYIVEGSKHSLEGLTKILDNANPEEFKLNINLLEESLDAYFTMKESNTRNKWKEGVAGGAIAGSLIVGLSAAVSPISTLAGASVRLFSGALAGGTSALIYNEVSKNCDSETKRVSHIKGLLVTAKERLEMFEQDSPSPKAF